DRALCGAACDPAPVGDSPGRRERNRGGVAGRAGTRRWPGGAAALAPERARAGPRRAGLRAGARARRGRAGGVLARPPAADPHLYRDRGRPAPARPESVSRDNAGSFHSLPRKLATATPLRARPERVG